MGLRIVEFTQNVHIVELEHSKQLVMSWLHRTHMLLFSAYLVLTHEEQTVKLVHRAQGAGQ